MKVLIVAVLIFGVNSAYASKLELLQGKVSIEKSISNTLEEKVIKFISDCTKIDIDRIKISYSFQEDLNLDDLDIMEILIKVEYEFGVEIPQEEYASMITVNDLVDYLEERVEKK